MRCTSGYFIQFSCLELQLHKLAHEKHTDAAAHVVEFDFEVRLVEADARQTTLSRRGTREESTSFRAECVAEYTDRKTAAASRQVNREIEDFSTLLYQQKVWYELAAQRSVFVIDADVRLEIHPRKSRDMLCEREKSVGIIGNCVKLLTCKSQM